MVFAKKWVGIACAAVLFIALVVGLAVYLTSPSGYLAIDVNPSMELTLNRMERVAVFKPLNDEAQSLAQGLKLENEPIESAVTALVERMLEKGYFDDTANNVIMLSLDEKTISSDTLERINNAVNQALGNRLPGIRVINQKLGEIDGAANEAHSNCISVGKYTLISKLIENGAIYSMEDLAKYSMSELLAYAHDMGIEMDGVSTYEDMYCDDCGRLNSECKDKCNGNGDYCEHCGKTEKEQNPDCRYHDYDPYDDDDHDDKYCDDCGRLNSECKDKCNGNGDYCEHCGKTEKEQNPNCRYHDYDPYDDDDHDDKYCDDCGRLNSECKDRCDEDGDFCEHCGKPEKEQNPACRYHEDD